MDTAYAIREYTDPNSNRRFISVSYYEAGASRDLAIPLDLLTNDILGFLADAIPFYANEILPNEGFQKLEKMILEHHQVLRK